MLEHNNSERGLENQGLLTNPDQAIKGSVPGSWGGRSLSDSPALVKVACCADVSPSLKGQLATLQRQMLLESQASGL